MKIEVGQVWVDLDHLGRAHVVTDCSEGYVVAEVYENGKSCNGRIGSTEKDFRAGKVLARNLELAVDYHVDYHKGKDSCPYLVQQGITAKEIRRHAKLEKIQP